MIKTLVAAGLLSGMIASQAAAEVRLTFVGFAPPNSGSEQIPNWWMDEIEKRTEGEVTFKRFPINQLCKGPEIIDCVRDGRADVGAVPQAYTPALFPISMIDGLPFVSPDQAAINKALATMYAESPAFRDEHNKLGLHLQLYWAADPLLIGTNFEAGELTDFAGKRIRGIGFGPGALISALGGEAVALATAEQYEALHSGVIDGYTNSFEGGVTQKLHEVTTHWYDPGFGVYATVGLWISDAGWAQLTPEQQTVVNDVTAELIAGKAQELYDASLEGFCDRIKTSGRVESFESWDAAMTAEVKGAVGDTAYNQWAEKVAAAGGADPKALYDEYLSVVRAAETGQPSKAQDCIATYK